MSGTRWLSAILHKPAFFSKSISASAQEGGQWPPLGVIAFWHFAYNNPSTAQEVAFNYLGRKPGGGLKAHE